MSVNSRTVLIQKKMQRTTRYSYSIEKKLVLGLVHNLCEELNTKGISYCHWKSNAMLDRSASGDNDLDLLVSRADVQLFTEILYRLGFKQAQNPQEQHLPGVLDYYGYDEASDRWVHVHAHYQLILGHDATKNYRLPIEIPYLESAVQGDLFKVPSPEFELVVFVIRMVLKHSTWDSILGRQGKLSNGERQEMEYLESRVSQGQMSDILKRNLPRIDTKLFDSCMRTLQPNCPFWIRVRVGQQLQRNLKAYSRRPQGLDLWLKFWRQLVAVVRWRLFGHITRKRMANGGLLIAIVGGDGAGKTTAVNKLYSWLSPRFATIKIHMGKPTWSLTTIFIRGLLKIGRSIGLYPFEKESFQYTHDTNYAAFQGYPSLIRSVCTARDRYLIYAKARRYESNGSIVICDRLPLPGIMLMDGPRSVRLPENHKANWLINLLMKREIKYYKSIIMPELLVVLKVDPEIAVIRKSDENEISVRARSSEIWKLNWQKVPAYVIDASRSEGEVFLELKSLVWSRL